MKSNQLKVAAVQMASFKGDFLKNRTTIKSLIEQASAQKAEVLVTPELSNVGYDLSILNNLEYNFQDEVSYYSNLARQYGITLALGLLEVEGTDLYNSLVVIDAAGNIQSKYRKNNLFPLGKEDKVFKKGSLPAWFNHGDFKIGLSICYDIRFPELYRAYLENDCNVIIVSSAFPFPRLEHWTTLLKAHAIMNQAYVIASNRIGIDGKLQFLGNSCIIDPWGEMIASFSDKEEGILTGSIELPRIDEVRNKIPAFSDRKKIMV
jgi:predicted amidohydrolase